jgi:hypothetical protein
MRARKALADTLPFRFKVEQELTPEEEEEVRKENPWLEDQ